MKFTAEYAEYAELLGDYSASAPRFRDLCGAEYGFSGQLIMTLRDSWFLLRDLRDSVVIFKTDTPRVKGLYVCACFSKA